MAEREVHNVAADQQARRVMEDVADSIGVNRPDLGGTVLNSAAVSRCPALLAFNPDFTKLLTV